jgi:glycerophosphoryl diester phosphodiesterase
MKIKKLILLGILLSTFGTVSAKTKVIAHRGFWNTEGSAQNSIAALTKANEIKVYG